MSARDRILARLRGAPIGEPVPLPDVAAWYAGKPAIEAAARIERFRANMEASHAEIHDTDAASWPDLLARIAASKGVGRMLIAGGSEAEALAHGKTCAVHGIQLVRYDKPAAEWREAFFDGIDAAFTPARSAVADTGSLILWPDAKAPRMMSLVPAIHFVLLDAACIHATLYEAMTAERWADGMPTNAVVISGPSKTADIQQTLAYGAHGPRELVILLLRSAS
jgi:L-lactate dehydrogenase complex protein LldG